MNTTELIGRGRDMCGRMVGTMDWHTAVALVDALEEAQAIIEKARAIPHGPFGPWEDDLCDHETLMGILGQQKQETK